VAVGSIPGPGPHGRDGYYFIVDRKTDMIIRGGYNVYPREVEDVLYEHPAVAEVAVIGVPHPELGQEVGARSSSNRVPPLAPTSCEISSKGSSPLTSIPATSNSSTRFRRVRLKRF